MKALSKTYDPKKVEGRIYQLWQRSGFFNPDQLPGQRKEVFSIIMPPPNANAPLHMGNAVFVTLEDLMIRYHRMKGGLTLWLPGADHAGILTQVVFEKELAKKGKTRFDLGREDFFKQTFAFTMKNKKTIESQLKKLGASCDWSREKFTLDKKISRAVFYTFKNLYNDGLIYRGERIINWCPRCRTALSDLEVIHEEVKTKLFYIKYPLREPLKKFIVVATTRPETMLGDTAIAVHPKDRRYKNFVGKQVMVPLVDRIIPIIFDARVKPEFGTGAVKVTPAHDPVDFEIGKQHRLSFISVISQEAKMTKEAGREFVGLNVHQARDIVLEKLKKKGYLVKEDPYLHTISKCERCKSIIEPLISKQWFIKTKILAKPAIEVVKRGEIKFIPKRFEKIYFHWMKDMRDWCISRQIWWGHRLPVWYCQAEKSFKKAEEKYFISLEKPKKCLICGKCKPRQDPDTLDTWFSSGQWPFTALGWPEKTKDFKRFYPTTVMETGWDIIFFWVARMIMLGLYCTKKVPFKIVYLHGLVRDKERQKMSKSRGNVINPLGVAALYGTDATRMALVAGVGLGNDVIISEEKIRGYRNFCNKIWNATRFILLQMGEGGGWVASKLQISDFKPNSKNLTSADKEILNKLNKTVASVTKNMEEFKFGQTAQTLHNFFWHDFCDRYIEESKKQLRTSDSRLQTSKILLYVLLNSLKLLHPFIPFITEEIYQKLPIKDKKKCLMIEEWPSRRN